VTIPAAWRRLVQQGGRFTVVGLLATGTHVTAALAAHNLLGTSPLWSNFIGFLVAVCVSYFGNWSWTFDRISRHGLAAPRFLAVAVGGFAINHAIVYVMSNRLGLPFVWAMAAVLFVVPAISFWLNRTRVFVARRAVSR